MKRCILISVMSIIIPLILNGQFENKANYDDVIDFLAVDGNHLEIEVTLVNEERPEGGHYYTSWGRALVSSLDENGLLQFSCYQKFSDRNFFKGNNDLVDFELDLKSNKLKLVLKSWNNAVVEFGQLQRDSNLIYKRTESGMIILNLKFNER